ncbi:cAMP-binding domain of CRP or a regulatory subunit of cAMP-dependent protein kinases [Chitinophaga terrae (ex Kim and Jung 2007)]|uniref:cAMP-binding domain of CRP or a regulatory subunit of cAMP-dependent protein kinases n=1 Tax=Chitinophaga terrae (ex Kim and Jung 2007) TaxID=408074 RepID=A0A1H4FGU0_9BACT|nr:Crp/Fnr family transcriptional regulator [Chitinophaga terrae (ex Kim and Jung 2007)]GEP92391.1 cAMP-binding protein [Chitinophaga terrae (ex Kim and Jung 2007)]SEA95702.1 cAMP-binding domain of CRP or a regulatory subunit of cAMP-dependent protein kinases [Chitinophaga terrae (ex Kim and Jung 2007)]
MEQIFDKLLPYGTLSDSSKQAFLAIMQERTVRKHEFFLQEGQLPRNAAFVIKGLFSQYFTDDEGNIVIKKFFAENAFMASISALLTNQPSLLSMKALETSRIYEFDFQVFRELMEQRSDLFKLYTCYIEQHWIIEKEPLEVAFRKDSAATRYTEFVRNNPHLISRLKQHEIASFLGITPTQLSRLKLNL